MELLTSSYASWRPGSGSPVSISLSTPRWLPEAARWPRLWEATPRWSYFHAEPEQFDLSYVDQLDRYGSRLIAERLAEIAKTAFMAPSDRLVLCCWEPLAKNCHRGLWARWWLETTGERIPELTPKEETK